MSQSERARVSRTGCRFVGLVSVAALVAMGECASGQITIDVYPSSAPNTGSFSAYALSALSSLQNGLGNIGDRSTDPTAYEIAPPVVPATEFMVTSYPSWRGVADPPAPFATEKGNRLHFGVHAYGDGVTKFTLEDLNFEMHSSDPYDALIFVGDFTGLSYNGTTRYGIDWGADNAPGGAGANADTVYTSGNGTTPVDEIVYVGVGNAFWPGGGDPDPVNPILGRQGAMDDAVNWVISIAPFTFSCTYTILGDTGYGQVLVLPAVVGTDPTKSNGDFIAGSGIPSDNFWRASNGTVSSFIKGRGRVSGEPLSIVGNRFRVLTGEAPGMPGKTWWSVDFQFTPDTADAIGGPPQYNLKFKLDIDPSAATSFATVALPFWDGDVDDTNSWDDTDGYFANPGGGAWSDDVTPFVLSQSWRPDFGFLYGSVPPAGLYDAELNVYDDAGSPNLLASAAIQIESVPAELQLLSVDSCLNASESQLVVELFLSGSEEVVAGGQYLLSYDNALLDFVSADPGDAPFTLEVYESVDEFTGKIVYASGVNFGDPGTNNPTVMARFTFNVLLEFCATADVVAFRGPDGGEQPTRLTDTSNTSITPATLEIGYVQNDNTPPVLTLPSNISVNADAGLCTASLNVGTATATDNCTLDSEITIVGVRDDLGALNDPYPTGTTTITWTATDECGNETTDDQTVTVAAFNTVDADVELAAVDPGAFDRCITFLVYPNGGGSPVEVSETITFTSGLGSASFDVPCGEYDCISARDKLHTLSRTDSDDFGISGAVYVADFTSTGSVDDDALVGGNANDDGFIDILDFGAFAGQFGLSLGADTDCSVLGPPPFHTDFAGNGTVDINDFTFISVQFFALSDAACGAGPIMTGGFHSNATIGHRRPLGEDPIPLGPRSSISVAELQRRGLGSFAAGDLNEDGMLDQNDMAAFALGARPARASDLNHDGRIDMEDVGLVLSAYGESDSAYDLDADGRVSMPDVMTVLGRLGTHLGE